jgi:hypothetical protein
MIITIEITTEIAFDARSYFLAPAPFWIQETVREVGFEPRGPVFQTK